MTPAPSLDADLIEVVGARPRVGVSKSPLGAVEHVIDLCLRDDERKAKRIVVAERTGDDAMHLGPLAGMGRDSVRRLERFLRFLVANQLERANQAAPARVSDQWMITGASVERAAPPVADARRCRALHRCSGFPMRRRWRPGVRYR